MTKLTRYDEAARRGRARKEASTLPRTPSTQPLRARRNRLNDQPAASGPNRWTRPLDPPLTFCYFTRRSRRRKTSPSAVRGGPMAKQRRPPPKTTKASSPVVRTSHRARRKRPTAAPQRRTTYVEAVALYERGLEALQRHDYTAAATPARIGSPPISGRKGAARARPAVPEHLPATGDAARRRAADDRERLYASTLAINGGRYDEAIAHLRLVRDEDPDNDHALYMLAVAHAQRGELAEAIAHLERAIALNPENRGARANRPRPRARSATTMRSAPRSKRRPAPADRAAVDRFGPKTATIIEP